MFFVGAAISVQERGEQPDDRVIEANDGKERGRSRVAGLLE